MNDFPRTVVDLVTHSPGAQRLGAALVHFVWQGALLAALAGLLALVLRRARPQVRYVALLSLLGAMALCPIVTFLAIDVESPAVEATDGPTSVASFPVAAVNEEPPLASSLVSPSSEAVTPDDRSEQAAERHDSPAPGVSEPPPPTDVTWTDVVRMADEWLRPRRPWIVAIWIAGVGLLSLRLGLGLLGAERARRFAVKKVTAEIEVLAANLAQRLAVSRPVRVLESALAEVPVLVGWLRPVILLPASALCGLSPRELEAILAHELAHVRRHDALVNLGQTVVETLLFYHPAVWWISRRIRQEREHCCDDLAVAVCRDPLVYARALAAMEELRAAPQWLVAARGGSLPERIRRLIGRPEPAANGRAALAAVLAIALLVSAVTLSLRPDVSADEALRAEAAPRAVATEVGQAADARDAALIERFPDLGLVEREIGSVPFQHEADINSIAWLDGGKSLLTGSPQGLRVWDVASRRVIREIEPKGFNYVVASVDTSQTRIAVLEYATKPQLLEWPSGRTLREFDVERGSAIALSPNGKMLAVATRDNKDDKLGRLLILDADSGNLLSEHTGRATLALGWSSDSKVLAAGDNLGTAIFLKPDGTAARASLKLEPAEQLLAVAFDEDSKHVALLTAAGTCSVWDLSTGDSIWKWTSPLGDRQYGHYMSNGGLVFVDGDRLFARSFRTSMVFDATNGTLLSGGDGNPSSGFANLAMSPDKRTVAQTTERYAVDFVDATSGQSTLLPDVSHPSGTHIVRLSNDRRRMLLIGETRVDVWSLQPLVHLGGSALASHCYDAALSSDGRFVATVGYRKKTPTAVVEIMDVSESRIVRTIPVEETATRGVAFAPNGELIAVGETRHLSLRDAVSGAIRWRVPACEGSEMLEQVAFSPDGRRIAVVVRFHDARFDRAKSQVSHGGIRVFDAADGSRIHELVAAGAPVEIHFSRGATICARMSAFQVPGDVAYSAAVEWDVLTGKLRDEQAFTLPGREFSLVALDPAGKRALVRKDPSSPFVSDIRFWGVAPAIELEHLTLPWTVARAEFLPDNRLALVKRNGNLVVIRDPASDGEPTASGSPNRASAAAPDRTNVEAKAQPIVADERNAQENDRGGTAPDPQDKPDSGVELRSVQLNPPAGGVRRLRIQPRTDGGRFDAGTFPAPETPRPKQVLWFSGGVNLLIEGIDQNAGGQPTGTIDLSADRIVIWTDPESASNLSGGGAPEQDSNLPLEVYLEGNIIIREGQNVLRGSQAFYDLRKDRALLLNAEPGTRIAPSTEEMHVRARELRQLAQAQDAKGRGEDRAAAVETDKVENDKPDPQKPWSVHGRVTDADGKPMAGVLVTAHAGMGTLFLTGQAETAIDGTYRFDFGPGVRYLGDDKDAPQVQAATITAHKTGFSEKNLSRQGDLVAAFRLPDGDIGWGKKTKEDVILPGKPRRIDYVMVPAAKVAGTLLGPDERPLAGHSVSLRGEELPPSSSVVAQVKTDDEGRFVLADVPTGYQWQLLIEPAKALPPWRAWASGRLKFAADEAGRFRIRQEKTDLTAERFEVQVLGEGTNWKEAIAAAVGANAPQKLTIEQANVDAELGLKAARVRLVLGQAAAAQPPAPDRIPLEFKKTAPPAAAAVSAAEKTHLRRTKPDAEGRFTITFDNPLLRGGANRQSLDPEKHQVIFQVFVRDAGGKLQEKIFRQLPARKEGGYRADVQVKPELMAHSSVSITFVTIQPEHDAWVKAFFHEGKGTSYSGMWSGDGGKLSEVAVDDKAVGGGDEKPAQPGAPAAATKSGETGTTAATPAAAAASAARILNEVIVRNRFWLDPRPANLAYTITGGAPAPNPTKEMTQRAWIGDGKVRWEMETPPPDPAQARRRELNYTYLFTPERTFALRAPEGVDKRVLERLHDTHAVRQGMTFHTAFHELADRGVPRNCRIVDETPTDDGRIVVIEAPFDTARLSVGLGAYQLYFGRIGMPIGKVRLHVRLPDFVPVREEYPVVQKATVNITFGPKYLKIGEHQAPATMRLTQVTEPAPDEVPPAFKEWILEGQFQDAGGVWILEKAVNMQDGKPVRQLEVSDVSTKPVPAERFDPAAK